eukprot:Plantae.Rhodophyta-Hildenbrandia_rubra.ctg9345.p1 GENE.Plantae.Rhodophyta-Hildenbrandia_rubra.ctg9345~~Plantae.Rhodophyta-Hildenbrandia_rubra.ctg9345.p1  ORF type:complete len:426 (+),score=65.12 Plantae.Rhodophyta-Hildenbrandia_rubra.ctg9345:187-1464(+)
MVRILAGDIGGTNSRLVLYENNAISTGPSEREILEGHDVISQIYYKNHDYSSFTQILAEFLSHDANIGPISSACFAVAGPVSSNRINFTNREGWIIDAHDIKQEFPIKEVRLINDFVANGYGLLGLRKSDCEVLQEGRKSPDQPIALVGAGTGLGECFLTPDENGRYVAYPSEGGHVEFAPKTALEEELLNFIQKKVKPPLDTAAKKDNDPGVEKPRISVERVVSGGGLENIYEFMRKKYPDEVDATHDEEVLSAQEKGRVISALKYDYTLCKMTLELMFKAYGSEVGNVALKYMPYGGLYVAGGIAPKNLEFINSPNSEFMKSFWDKGRMRTIMADFPVYVVKKEDLGLRGAHVVASRLAAGVNGRGPLKKINSARNAPSGPADSLSAIVGSYPLTWAVASTVSAALTATAIISVTFLMTRKSK